MTLGAESKPGGLVKLPPDSFCHSDDPLDEGPRQSLEHWQEELHPISGHISSSKIDHPPGR